MQGIAHGIHGRHGMVLQEETERAEVGLQKAQKTQKWIGAIRVISGRKDFVYFVGNLSVMISENQWLKMQEDWATKSHKEAQKKTEGLTTDFSEGHG